MVDGEPFSAKITNENNDNILIIRTKTMKKFALGLVALAMLAVLPACSNAIKTEGVTGVVTYNGEPLADATVKFLPTDGTGSQSYGKTNEKGEYKLQTILGAADAGTTPGEYKVTVDCVETYETGVTFEENGEEKNETKVRSVIPEKYNNPETSGLTATVNPGDNKIDFALEDE